MLAHSVAEEGHAVQAGAKGATANAEVDHLSGLRAGLEPTAPSMVSTVFPQWTCGWT
jgi:hypothetical protein